MTMRRLLRAPGHRLLWLFTGRIAVVLALLATMVTRSPVTLAQTTPQAGQPAYMGIAVNGDCHVGECPPTAHSANSTVNTPVDFTITLANGDRFHVAGFDRQVNHGCAVEAVMDVSVQYVGNPTGGASDTDNLDLDLYRSFTCTAKDPPTYRFDPSGRFSPNIAPSSSVEFTGRVSPELHAGPFAAPKAWGIEGFGKVPVSGGAVQWQHTYSLVFGAGSHIGSYILLNQARVPPRVPLPMLVLDWATTTDAQTVDVQFTTSQADFKQPITLSVYRSDKRDADTVDPANQIGAITMDPASLTSGPNTVRLDSLIDGALVPNTNLPFVVVIAEHDPTEEEDARSVNTTYFRKFLLGAVVHGFASDADRWLAWMYDMSAALKANKGFDAVVLHDWVRDSTVGSPGEAAKQGPLFFDQIAAGARRLLAGRHRGDTVDVHLFGHSRGTVVESATLCYFPNAQCSDALLPQGHAAGAHNELKGSYIEVTLLDPHPANTNHMDLIDSGALAKLPPVQCDWFASFTGDTCLLPKESPYQNVLAFQDAAQDPEPELPGNIGIRAADLWFQNTPESGCGVQALYSDEFFLNLWGERYVATNPGTDPAPHPAISIQTYDLTCHQLDDGKLIGHREVPDCYLQDVVAKGLVDAGATMSPTCGLPADGGG